MVYPFKGGPIVTSAHFFQRQYPAPVRPLTVVPVRWCAVAPCGAGWRRLCPRAGVLGKRAQTRTLCGFRPRTAATIPRGDTQREMKERNLRRKTEKRAKCRPPTHRPPTLRVEANDSFQRHFSPSCNFQSVAWKFDDSARSLVRKICLKHWCLCVLRTLPLSLSLTCSVVDGRRFRPTSGHPEFISVFIMLVQQQSEPSVEERNLLSGANKFSSC